MVTISNNSQAGLIVAEKSPYRLVIPLAVEQKIRYHIARFPNTEWSGYMFYRYTGSFDDAENPLVITAADFFVLDVGTSVATAFNDCPEVLTYRINHNLLDCQEALIHSHHKMGASFSSVDDAALIQEGNNCNHFLSLVVDTRGTYVARITRKLQVSQQIHSTIVEETSYNSYDNKHIVISKPEPVVKDSTNAFSQIVAYNLSVEIESAAPSQETDWENNLQNILDKKNMRYSYPCSSAQIPPVYMPAYRQDSFFGDEIPTPNSKVIQPLTKKDDIEKGEDIIGDDELDYMILQIITGNITISETYKAHLVNYFASIADKVKTRFSNDDYKWAGMTARIADILITEYVLEYFPYGSSEDTCYDLVLDALKTRLDSYTEKTASARIKALLAKLSSELNSYYK